MTKLDITFTWKLHGGDAFEQTFTGYDSYAEAREFWSSFWGVDESDCEAFSFTLGTSAIEFETKHKETVA